MNEESKMDRSWRHATDHGEIAKVTQLARWNAAGAVPAIMDVLVIMQRRYVSRQWRCLGFSLSPKTVDIPVRNRDG